MAKRGTKHRKQRVTRTLQFQAGEPASAASKSGRASGGRPHATGTVDDLAARATSRTASHQAGLPGVGIYQLPMQEQGKTCQWRHGRGGGRTIFPPFWIWSKLVALSPISISCDTSAIAIQIWAGPRQFAVHLRPPARVAARYAERCRLDGGQTRSQPFWQTGAAGAAPMFTAGLWCKPAARLK